MLIKTSEYLKCVKVYQIRVIYSSSRNDITRQKLTILSWGKAIQFPGRTLKELIISQKLL